MKKATRLITATVFLVVCAVSSLSAQVAGPDTRRTLHETDQVLPAGLWRFGVENDAFTIAKNTAAAADFSTANVVTIPNITGTLTSTATASGLFPANSLLFADANGQIGNHASALLKVSADSLIIGTGTFGTGVNLTAVGVNALLSNTIGNASTAVGVNALQNNTTGGLNTAVGVNALLSNTTGFSLTAVGVNAMSSNTLGINHVALGVQAGDTITTGNNDIFIGFGVDAPLATTSDFMTIGNLIFATGGFGTGITVGIGNVGVGQPAPTARLHVKAASATNVGLIVDTAAAPTADIAQFKNATVVKTSVKTDGAINFAGTTFAALGTPANGTVIYCSDCTITNPCAGAGTGAIAKRLNAAWVCN